MGWGGGGRDFGCIGCGGDVLGLTVEAEKFDEYVERRCAKFYAVSMGVSEGIYLVAAAGSLRASTVNAGLLDWGLLGLGFVGIGLDENTRITQRFGRFDEWNAWRSVGWVWECWDVGW